jgi:hypothetical protein
MINDTTENLIKKLTENKFYQDALSHVKDPKERKNIEEQTIKIYQNLLNAFIPTINRSLEDIDSTIDENIVIIKENK